MKLSAESVSMIEFTSRLGASSFQEFDEVSVRSLMKPEPTSASRYLTTKIVQHPELLKARLLPFFLLLLLSSCTTTTSMISLLLLFVLWHLSCQASAKSSPLQSFLFIHTYTYAHQLQPCTLPFLHQSSRI